MRVTPLSFGIPSVGKPAFAVHSLASTATRCHRAQLSLAPCVTISHHQKAVLENRDAMPQSSFVSCRHVSCMHVTVCRPLSWQCLGSLTPPVSLGSVLFMCVLRIRTWSLAYSCYARDTSPFPPKPQKPLHVTCFPFPTQNPRDR
jgi:hypothetical protein